MIRAILACDDEWGIGKDGGLPWPHNPADLKWFKENTIGSYVIMGRKTWESLPRRPLPKRHNVVVSSAEVEGATYTFNNEYQQRIVDLNYEFPVWIIGGAKLIESCLDIIDEVWLSRISGTYNCDTFLPQTLIEEKFRLSVSELQKDVYVEVWERR